MPLTDAFSRAARLLRLARQPGGFRAFRTWKPFSITSFEMTRRLAAAGYHFKTVIDGGANAGQFARACAQTWPDARVYSFEPLPGVARTLRHNLRDLAGRVHIGEVALGASAGTVTFHETPYSLQSSVLRPVGHAFTAIEVEQARLDSLLGGEPLEAPVLLKLDLQGYELEALRGAPAVLARTHAVLLEIAFEAAYENEPSFEKLRLFLAEAGFAFHRPFDVLWENDQIVQMDALFVRSDARSLN